MEKIQQIKERLLAIKETCDYFSDLSDPVMISILTHTESSLSLIAEMEKEESHE